MLSAQGVYPLTIPSGTRVPNWAYIKPLDHNDSFNPQAAKLKGGEFLTYRCSKTSFHFRTTDAPESGIPHTSTVMKTTTHHSVVSSRTHTLHRTSTSANNTATHSPPVSTPSGSNGIGRNESSSLVASGVLGGLLGLIIVGCLGALIYRCGRRAGERLAEPGPGTGTAGTSSTLVSHPGRVGGIAGGPSAGNWGSGLSNKYQYSAVPLTSPHAEAEPQSWGHGPGGYGHGGLWPLGGPMNMPAPDPNVATPVHVYVKFPPPSFYFGAPHVTDLVIISLFSICCCTV